MYVAYDVKYAKKLFFSNIEKYNFRRIFIILYGVQWLQNFSSNCEVPVTDSLIIIRRCSFSEVRNVHWYLVRSPEYASVS